MKFQSLISAAAFEPQSINHPNAWIGHIPFLNWLLRETSPKVFVELGTHTGNSYFAACQSIKESNLSTVCFAVDTWLGDAHAGSYSEDIFNNVAEHNKLNYQKFSSLMRMTFDDALDSFDDGTIDLLHIDGLHTYDAVKHDFKTWLPKLSPNAMVLFHDTNVFDRGFGVHQLWRELQDDYPLNIEFKHSYGLGVIKLNGAENCSSFDWLSKADDKSRLTEYFEVLGTNLIERFNVKILKETLELKDKELLAYMLEDRRLKEQLNQAQEQLKEIFSSRVWRLYQFIKNTFSKFRI